MPTLTTVKEEKRRFSQENPACRICGKPIKKLSSKYKYCSIHSGMIHQCKQLDKFKCSTIEEIEDFVRVKMKLKM